MGFLDKWRESKDKEFQDLDPMDTLDNMDTIRSNGISNDAPSNSVHSVHSVHKGENSKNIGSKEWFHRQTRKTIAEFNRRGISIMDYPPATRHRAFEIEDAMTAASNSGDREAFMEYLRQWRECFH